MRLPNSIADSWEAARNLTVAGNELTVLIVQLRPAAKYSVRVTAVNGVGEGQRSVPVYLVTGEEGGYNHHTLGKKRKKNGL